MMVNGLQNEATINFSNLPQRACLEAQFSASLVECGVVLKAMDGHQESGDQYMLKALPNGVLIAAIDGLGHGKKAAHAAKGAVEVLKQYAQEPLVALIKRCHKRLVGTRGVVMSLAFIDPARHSLTWLGIGNVHGVLVRADSKAHPQREALLLRGGTVGYRLPTLRPETRALNKGDTLIFVSDGVRSGFVREVDLSLSAQEIADLIFERHARGTDDTLVLVTRYVADTLP